MAFHFVLLEIEDQHLNAIHVIGYVWIVSSVVTSVSSFANRVTKLNKA